MQRTQRAFQHGYALIAAIVLVGLIVTAALVTSLSSTAIKSAHDQATAIALRQAKEALLGYALSHANDNSNAFMAGWLPCPDAKYTITQSTGQDSAGSATTPCGAGGTNPVNAVGRLPWKALGLAPIHDGAGECLWYVVNGRFKNSGTSAPDQINYTTGDDRLEVYDGSSGTPTLLASNVAAVILAPGAVVGNQTRGGSTSTACGSATNSVKYDPTQYLEAYAGINNATISNSPPTVSTNVSTTQPDKYIVAPANTNSCSSNCFNDQLVYITNDEIANVIKKAMPDLTSAIAGISNSDLQTLATSTTYGTPLNDQTTGTLHQGLIPFGDHNFSAPPIKLSMINFLMPSDQPSPFTYFVSNNCLRNNSTPRSLCVTGANSGDIHVTDADSTNVTDITVATNTSTPCTTGCNSYTNIEAVVVIASDALGTPRTVSVNGINVSSNITVLLRAPHDAKGFPTTTILR